MTDGNVPSRPVLSDVGRTGRFTTLDILVILEYFKPVDLIAP